MSRRFTNEQLADCAAREVSNRVRVYKRLVGNGGMSQKFADEQIAMMAEIRDLFTRAAKRDKPELPL